MSYALFWRYRTVHHIILCRFTLLQKYTVLLDIYVLRIFGRILPKYLSFYHLLPNLHEFLPFRGTHFVFQFNWVGLWGKICHEHWMRRSVLNISFRKSYRLRGSCLNVSLTLQPNGPYAQLHYFLNLSQLLVSCLPLLAKFIIPGVPDLSSHGNNGVQ